MKKTIAIVLLVSMLCLAGCGTGVIGASTPTPEPTAEVPAGPDFDAAFEAYPADAVVMTVDGSDVTWAEFYYWLYYQINYLQYYMGEITDFSQVSAVDETMTYDQYLLEAAKSMCVQYHSLEVNSAEAGVSLADVDKAELDAMLQSDIVSSCGEGATEEDFYAYLADVFVTPELYNYINSVSMLYTTCFDATYGEDGSLMDEEQVWKFVEDNGYMTAKHILISTAAEEGAEVTEEDKAAARAEAEGLLEQLQAAEGEEALVALFDQLEAENSDDPGMDSYPGGYCFASGSMVAEFEEACKALEPYQLSGVVETSYGFHIILRMPTTLEDIVEYHSEEEQYNLRYMAATDAYDAQVTEWIEGAEVVWKDGFDLLSINDLLGIEVAAE